MPNLAAFNSAAFLTTGQLAVAANATIEVRREDTSALASIFSDEAGTTPITNPSAFADSSGRFTFYAAGIRRGYSILVTKGAESFTLDNVSIGSAGMLDAWATFWDAVLAATTAAASRLALGFSAIAAKGDLLIGTAADTIATLTVGANGRIPMARSADAKGLAYVAALNKAIYGFTYQPSVGSPTDPNDLDIAAGGAMDATGAYWITGAASQKSIDVAWSVGSGGGSLLSGVIGNNDYNLWAMARSDTGVTDYGTELASNPNPTLPSNYDFKRLIGWFKRVSGTIVAFDVYETEGGGIELAWDSPTLDVNLDNTLTTTARTDALKVPLNFSVVAKFNVYTFDATTSFMLYMSCPDSADLAPSDTAAPLHTKQMSSVAANAQSSMFELRTSATGTVRARANLATVDNYRIATLGFRWARRN